jgi:hypothetical protein
LLFADAGLFGKRLAALHRARGFEQAFGRADPNRLEGVGDFAFNALDIGDGIRHPCLQLCFASVSRRSNETFK